MLKIIDKHSLIVVHGASWIGKTSLACFNLGKLVERKFLPIIFQERNLISPSTLLGRSSDLSGLQIQRLSLKDKAGILHEEIVTSIFRGDSCAILFDDPFGHRYFRPYSSPLSYLRILDWVKLSEKNTSLGSIKIIINTPTIFWDEAQKILEDDNTSPILKENIEWIIDESNKQVNIQKLSLSDYTSSELIDVVKNVATSLNCQWIKEPLICDLVAESIVENCDSFDTLRLFCLETQDLLDEGEILNSAEKYFEKSSELNYEINSLSEEFQVFLITVYLSEAFEQLSRDYLYSKFDFKSFCVHLKVDGIISRLTEDKKSRKKLDYWINFDSQGSNNNFPKFRHPDRRSSLENFVRENKGNQIASKILSNSDFVFCFSQEIKSIMRWESIYFICYFAYLLDQELCQYIHDNWFSLSKTEFDFNQTLWAISDNWHSIKGSFLEEFSIRAMKRIQNDFPSSRRNFMWEVLNNWTYMPEDIRYLVVKLNGEERGGTLQSKISSYHSLSFLGAVISNYQTLFSYLNRANSEATRLCIDFTNEFIFEISKEKNLITSQYKSFNDDRIFENQGVFYNGRDVLLKIRKLGLNQGGLTEKSQIIKNIDSALSKI
jgi:hypothetical protein